MEIKDIVFSTGIVATLIIGLFTLALGFKNRRNTLREHLYKEQITFFSKFLLDVNKLNLEIEGLLNNPSKRKANNFYELLEVVSYQYYNFEFLIPNEISWLINNLIFKGNKFYLIYLSTDEDKIRVAYSNYFESYTDMLNYIKEFIGTNELSNENRILHSQKNKISPNNILKLIMEVSEKTLINRM